MKLLRYEVINGKIRNTEGLRIGGTREAAGIGETDNPILRHPISYLPYIPGSSFKGKLRSLLEQRYSTKTQSTGKPCVCNKKECVVCSVFGCGDPTQKDHEPTRIIFRDAPLDDQSAQLLAESIPGTMAEVKTETAMNRNTGGIQHGSLRSIERILLILWTMVLVMLLLQALSEMILTNQSATTLNLEWKWLKKQEMTKMS